MDGFGSDTRLLLPCSGLFVDIAILQDGLVEDVIKDGNQSEYSPCPWIPRELWRWDRVAIPTHMVMVTFDLMVPTEKSYVQIHHHDPKTSARILIRTFPIP